MQALSHLHTKIKPLTGQSHPRPDCLIFIFSNSPVISLFLILYHHHSQRQADQTNMFFVIERSRYKDEAISVFVIGMMNNKYNLLILKKDCSTLVSISAMN